MGTLINFLLDNFIYVAFVCILLVLALIGYIVDTTKSKKIRTDLLKEKEENPSDIPVVDANVKLGETVNKMASMNTPNVNTEGTPKPLNVREEPPKP